MPQQRTRKLVVTGVMGAISVLLGLTHWGFIPWFGGFSLTIMHVPVIIGAVLEGPIVGLGIGLIFGVFSMLQAAIAPSSPNDVIFTNPAIALLPRLAIGPVTYYVWSMLKKIPVIGLPIIVLPIAGVVGSLTNTVLVLGVIGLLGILEWPAIWLGITTNGLLEAGLSAFLTLVVVAAWKQIRIGKKEGADL